MSQHPRIEEVSDTDSDPSDMDPAEFDPANIMERVNPSSNKSLITPSAIPASSAAASQERFQTTRDSSTYKHYQCLYPLYFDAGRSRAEGRRVGKELAIPNPLAREIVDAVQNLGLSCVFEPGKCHPKDWANPGRIKVLIKKDGKPVNPRVKNKKHLYTLVSPHLKAHPTVEASPNRLRVPGLPPPDPGKPTPPPAIPRGWKMGTILPLHSPAVSGGGVSENLLKDMMAEMGQGQLGAPDEPPATKKKDKKDKTKKVKG